MKRITALTEGSIEKNIARAKIDEIFPRTGRMEFQNIQHKIYDLGHISRVISKSIEHKNVKISTGRMFIEEMLISLMRIYHFSYHEKPVFTDRHRRPGGKSTRWTRSIIRSAVRNFESFCEQRPECLPSGPWLPIARRWLLNADQLSDHTLAARLRLAWLAARAEFSAQYGHEIEASVWLNEL
jgi:hypothetical protein